MTSTAPTNKGLPPKPPPPPPPPPPSAGSTADNPNPPNNNTGGLPPKPISFRRQSTPNASIPPLAPKPGEGPKRRSSTSSADSNSSSQRRAALQNDVSKRITALTHMEANFLKEIIVHGTDEEVEIAHENLLDQEDLFVPSTHDNAADEKTEAVDDPQQQKVARAWLQQKETSGGGGAESVFSSLRSSGSTNTQVYLNPNSATFTATSSLSDPTTTTQPPEEQPPMIKTVNSTGVDSVGSDRRQELLQQRKEQNQALWQAHENGLAVTKQGSRRSLRSNSFRFAGTNARSSAIFRRGRNHNHNLGQSLNSAVDARRSGGGRNALDGSNHSTNSYGGGIPLSGSLRSSGNSNHSSGRRPSLRRLSSDTGRGSSKPALRRLLSDSSRKSVTFVNVPPRDSSQRSSWGEFHRRSLRSGSFSSIPSIHMAYPVRSNSITSTGTTGTFPLLPHVRAMRSSSFGSQSIFSQSSYNQYNSNNNEGRDPSHDEASTRDAAAYDEEKKVEDLWPSVPSKVEIRKDGLQQTENSAKYLKTTKQQQPLNETTPLTGSDRYESTSSEYFQSIDDSEALSITAAKTDEEEPPVKQVLDPASKATVSASKNHFHRPVLMRDVSIGEGVEVADFAEQVSPTKLSPSEKMGVVSAGEFDFDEGEEAALQMANSYDETMSFARMADIFRRPIKRSLSDEAAAGLFVGPVNVLRDSFHTSQKEVVPDDGDSWQMDEDEEWDHYDSWLVIEDEYENGFGGGGTLPFQILGTSASDASAQPHVLSPPLMESLQQFLPFSLTGENFWMKYSMIRDGASMHTFLKKARNARHSILAVETVEGEVFGAFTSESWRKSWNFFGTGESFVWRMRHNRTEKARSIIDQAHRESELEVFPFTNENSHVQYCTDTRLAVGGGAGSGYQEATNDIDESEHTEIPIKDHMWGYSISIQGDSLLQGTSSPCLTFGSPSLSKIHADGTVYEIMNLELWTLTPCYTLEEAEKMELSKLFLEKYRKD